MVKKKKAKKEYISLPQSEIEFLERRKELKKIRAEQEELGLARIEEEKETTFGRIKGYLARKPTAKFRRLPIQRFQQPALQLTKEQNMLHEMFGGEPTFGTGENLPKIDGVLNSGHGLIKNDDDGETGSMFGFRRQR